MQKIPQTIEFLHRASLFKNYHKDIKAICKEYEKGFQSWAFYLLKISCYVNLY